MLRSYAIVTLVLGLGGAATAEIRFEEGAAAAGLRFSHFGASRAALLPEDNGSGLAFGDYDNDGDDDLYVVNLAGPVLTARSQLRATREPGRLFRNRGDGTFEDVTQSSGLRHVGWGMGAVWVDADDDGWLDLLITGLDEVRLFRNSGAGGFSDVSVDSGLGELPCFATGSAVADYDGDGDLDLYVPCYVDFPWEQARNRPLVGGRPATMTTPASYPAQPNLLFRNDGSGRFDDVATAAGVADPLGRGLQALFADFDDDGLPDLYLANDQSFDRLFHNRGDGTFADVSIEAGTRDPRAGMGVALGDYDADGRDDLFLTHWVGEQNALYRNQSADGLVLFEDTAYQQGLAPVDPSWVGWGTGLFDFDLDGDLDLFVVNGSTIEDEWTLEVLSDPKMIPQPLRVYEHRSDGFADVSAEAGPIMEELFVGRGAAFADVDRDGLVDVAVSVHGGSPLLLGNRSERRGHWLAVRLEGRSPNRFAVGARVIVHTEARRVSRRHLVGESYLSDNSAELHFGLGPEAIVSDVEVVWPNGARTHFGKVPVDGTVLMREGVAGWLPLVKGLRASRPWGLSRPEPEIRDEKDEEDRN